LFLGLFDLPWWGYALVALGLTHVTIAAVTIFLHRHQTHRALELHPAVSHFFRFWLWLTTGMVTKEWVAVHRKHHAQCETPEDPHSPQVYGLRKVLFQGAGLYRTASKDAAMVEKFGRGTPDDRLERALYTRHAGLGIGLMLIIDVLLFGWFGIAIWAVQMIWIPLFAAGVINGIGHYWGYRNFAPNDASRNIVPLGLLIGGEELHNNHHAYSNSAKLSNKWWEFDIGWLYIRLLQGLRLAKVRKVAPRVRLDPLKTQCDAQTLRAVLTHRYDVLARYARHLGQTAMAEIRERGPGTLPHMKNAAAVKALRYWLQRDTQELPAPERAALDQALLSSRVLATIYSMREELAALWGRTAHVRDKGARDRLVAQLEDWCRRADASGINALQAFSRELRCYA